MNGNIWNDITFRLENKLVFKRAYLNSNFTLKIW